VKEGVRELRREGKRGGEGRGCLSLFIGAEVVMGGGSKCDYSQLKRGRCYGGGPNHWGLSMARVEGSTTACEEELTFDRRGQRRKKRPR
jgi:hypothetical protein